MKQFDLFECQKELDIQAKQEQMFQKWRLLPPERLILAGTPDRLPTWCRTGRWILHGLGTGPSSLPRTPAQSGDLAKPHREA